MKELSQSKMMFLFDFLEKIRYTSVLLSVFSKMEAKLSEAKLKNPSFDFWEQEKMILDLQGFYIWTCALYEEKEIMYRHNLNLERLIIDLKTVEKELKKEIETLKKIDKF